MLKKPSFTRSRQPQPESPDRALRFMELAVESVKALAWPVLVLIGAIAFFAPLDQMAHGLARKIDDANKISIGSLSVEIEAKIGQSTNPELAKQVGSLSPLAIEQLMRTNHGGGVRLLSTMAGDKEPKLGLPKKAQLDALLELEAKGFLVFDQPFGPFLKKLRASPQEPSAEKNADHEWFIVREGTNSEVFQQLRLQGYQLTNKGKSASLAILKAVSELLSRKPG